MSKFGRLSLAVLAASLFQVSCSDSEPEPITYSPGDSISLGLFTIKVTRAERMQALHPLFSGSRSVPEGEKAIAVHVTWSGLKISGNSNMNMHTLLEDILSIVDDVGDRYPADEALTRSEFMLNRSEFVRQLPAGGSSRSSVVVFYVHEESHDLVLMIEHPDPRDGSSRLLAVPLGM